jgi:hypothetical protein
VFWGVGAQRRSDVRIHREGGGSVSFKKSGWECSGFGSEVSAEVGSLF